MIKKFIFSSIILIIFLTSCKKDKSEDIIVYKTDFNSDDKTWPINNGDICTYRFDQGKYEIEVDSAGYIYWAFAPYAIINYNYSVKVDCSIHLDDSTKIGYIGIVFNYLDNKNFSLLKICNNGCFTIHKEKDGISNTLIDWTYIDEINKGAHMINTLEIIQNDASTDLLINNKLICSFSIEKESNYVKVGLLANTSSKPNYSKVVDVFDNLVIKRINE